MIEIPLLALIFFAVMFGGLGWMAGQLTELTTRDGRRKRALAKVTPTWEVHIGSDGTDYGYGVVGTGHNVVVSARKVRRSGSHFELLQKIEVASVPGDRDPNAILEAVDKSNEMVNVLTLAGGLR